MRPSVVWLLLAGVAAAFVAGLVSSAAGARTARTSPICRRGNTSVEVDPRGLLPLTANPIGPSVNAALRDARSGKPQVVAADLAVGDHQRGGEAKFECGSRPAVTRSSSPPDRCLLDAASNMRSRSTAADTALDARLRYR